MTTLLRRAPILPKQPRTAPDADCQLARQVKGLAAAFVARPWRVQLGALVRLQLTFSREALWSFRAALPRDFHTREQLARAERDVQDNQAAARGRKGTNRQR